ncbi:MAG: DNA ligase-associated DEXH box helicase, partial [Cyclobacteriaceae bacterium]
TRHLQATSGILYGVFETYDPENLLLAQAKREVLNIQMEKDRLLEVVNRINLQRIHLVNTSRISPFAFPIMVDRMLRSSISSESLEDRVMKMQASLLS